MLYNGSSEGICSLSAAISAYIFNMAFMNIAGESGVAAFTAINYIGQFGVYVLFGISDGIGPIISYSYGGRLYHRVKEALKLSYLVGLAIGSFVIYGRYSSLVKLLLNGLLKKIHRLFI